jgi:hypothetical protein
VRLRRPSHATIVAYLALFVALGGSVYAANRISGSRLKPNSVTGRQVKEKSLNASQFLPASSGTGHPCGAGSGTDLCAHAKLRLHRPSRIIAIGNGSWGIVVPQGGPPYNLFCSLAVDGKLFLGPAQQQYGEDAVVNSSDTGLPFALAGTSKTKLRAGTHKVQLRCNSDTGAVRAPTITAFAISSGR